MSKSPPNRPIGVFFSASICWGSWPSSGAGCRSPPVGASEAPSTAAWSPDCC